MYMLSKFSVESLLLFILYEKIFFNNKLPTTDGHYILYPPYKSMCANRYHRYQKNKIIIHRNIKEEQ